MKDLVARLYDNLGGSADPGVIREVLHPDFVGVAADGMPVGAGTHRGPEAMIGDLWWAIGRAYRIGPVPEEYVECADGRLLVLGRYKGTHRGDGHEVDAAFMHLWTSDGERLTALTQLTDTARW